MYLSVQVCVIRGVFFYYSTSLHLIATLGRYAARRNAVHNQWRRDRRILGINGSRFAGHQTRHESEQERGVKVPQTGEHQGENHIYDNKRKHIMIRLCGERHAGGYLYTHEWWPAPISQRCTVRWPSCSETTSSEKSSSGFPCDSCSWWQRLAGWFSDNWGRRERRCVELTIFFT